MTRASRGARALTAAVEPNARNRIGATDLLARLRIEGHKPALVVFDPQYREVLDKLEFGNEGARQTERSALPQMTTQDIARCLWLIEGLLKPGGYLVLWMDKFCIATGRYRQWFDSTISLKTVDLIAWNKMRPGMGRRLRCATEYAIIAQKVPIKAKGSWHDHRLLDNWSEHHDRDLHPHAKPHQLTRRLIQATTKRGDLVVDPAAGGFGVLEACKETGRQFIGGDILG